MKFFTREVRGILFLLPVLAVISWLVWEVARPGTATNQSENDSATQSNFGQSGGQATLGATEARECTQTYMTAADVALAAASPPLSPKLFEFDPNTVSYHNLVRLGFTRTEALGITKYRARGKIFEIPEDFAACYQVSEAMFRRLKPYIKIGEKFRLKPFEKGSRRLDTIAAGSRHAATPSKLVDLNHADSAELVKIHGIGALTAGRIVAYRAALGGFASVAQLAEVRGMTEQNFERIVPQIYVDTLAITKISINFASAKSLAAHPYLKGETLCKLLSQRQLKGGWTGPEELKKEHIFTEDELKKLLPYLIFEQ